jgi:hypothetical protein
MTKNNKQNKQNLPKRVFYTEEIVAHGAFYTNRDSQKTGDIANRPSAYIL